MIAAFTSQHFTKPFKWLIISLCIKLFLYLVFILPDASPKRLYVGGFIKSGDHHEYIRPIDNYIDKGVYTMDGKEESYAGRLPGFVFPYIAFRIFFDAKTSCVLLGIFIVVLSVLASYALSLLAFKLIQKRWAFILTFLLANFIPYFWHYDWTLHTSSLGVSCFIFFAYYFYLYTVEHLKKHLLLAGFFFCWLLFLRGFCFVYFPFVLVFILVFDKRAGKTMTQLILNLSLFLMPFFVFETIWVVRNYVSLNKLVLLQTSFVPGADSKNTEYGYNSVTKYSVMKVREMSFAWGGENAWYFKNSDMGWFLGNKKDSASFKFDNSIFFDGFNQDTLLALKKDILFSYSEGPTKAQHDSIENKITRTANHLKNKFVANKTAYYYFYSPFKRLRNYLFRNPTQDWPGPVYSQLNFLQKLFKYFSLFSYVILLIQLIVFPFAWRRKSNDTKRNRHFLFYYILLLASILPFMFVIAMSHYTYFIFGFTLLIPIFVFNINALISKKIK